MSIAGTLGVMDWTVSTQVLMASMTLSWLLRTVVRISFCRSWVGVLGMALPPWSSWALLGLGLARSYLLSPLPGSSGAVALTTSSANLRWLLSSFWAKS